MKEELAALSNRLDLIAADAVSKVAHKFEEKPGTNNQDKFKSYMETAKKIALSVPDISQQNVIVPKGVDPDLVLFYI
jgi:hypothetical protein